MVVRTSLLCALLLCALSSTPARAQDAICDWEAEWFGCSGEDCWLTTDTKALHFLQGKKLGDDVTYSIGGALRYRYLDERNRLRPPLAAGESDYDQWRFTPYFEIGYQDWVTGYVQAIDAPTFNYELPQLAIDENRSDLLQYYVDLKVADLDAGKVRFRYGRQLLSYGSQHLVSPLAWANTFRNFEGYKLYFAGEAWSVDAFAVQPVDGASLNAFRPTSFDTPDQSRWFSGVYSTYKKAPGGTLDLYWLWLHEREDRVGMLDGSRHTLGVRYAGSKPVKEGEDTLLTYLWDVEGAYQFGEDDFLTGVDQSVQAGMLNVNGGMRMDSLPWSPTLTGIYYWGSGDRDPTDGRQTTFNTLFPLGHAYWGILDNFSGQNLSDYVVQLSLAPTKKLTLVGAWHWFDKAAAEDAIYNIGGVPFGGVSTTDLNIGNELDLIATYKLSANLMLEVGHSWFWYGDAVSLNPNPLVATRGDATQFYMFLDWLF
jgi:hypothetical protein